jgi:very-short-patch-repair endonuclease
MSEMRNRAKKLRRDQTDTERFVWSKLRDRRFDGYKFRRQVVLGNYIVDFVCLERRLITDLDGGQHGEPGNQVQDAQRDLWLRSQGFRVLRSWNHEVLAEWNGIDEIIWTELQKVVPDGRPQ